MQCWQDSPVSTRLSTPYQMKRLSALVSLCLLAPVSPGGQSLSLCLVKCLLSSTTISSGLDRPMGRRLSLVVPSCCTSAQRHQASHLSGRAHQGQHHANSQFLRNRYSMINMGHHRPFSISMKSERRIILPQAPTLTLREPSRLPAQGDKV